MVWVFVDTDAHDSVLVTWTRFTDEDALLKPQSDWFAICFSYKWGSRPVLPLHLSQSAWQTAFKMCGVGTRSWVRDRVAIVTEDVSVLKCVS